MLSEQKLRKNLTVIQGVALAVSMVVGSGLLCLPGLALDKGGVEAAAAGWVITTLVSLPLIHILMRLGLRFSSAAGLARYAQVGVGPWAGAGVAMVLVGTFVVCIPSLALVGGAYAQRLFGLSPEHQYWLAVVILGLATMVNSPGANWAGSVNTISLTALAAMIAYLVLSRFDNGATGVAIMADVVASPAQLQYAAVWPICVILFWAYIGWENLSFGLEEFRNPERSIPQVYWGSYVVVVIVYLSLAAITIGAEATGVSVGGAAGLVNLVPDSGFGIAVTAVMLMVILANANAWVFGASRLVYSASSRGTLPSFLCRLSGRQVPLSSLWSLFAAYLVVILVVGSGAVRLDTLIALVSQNFLVLYAFSIVAFLRTETGWSRWPVAAMAAGGCLFFLSGFGWWIFYPAILLGIGYLVYYRQTLLPMGGFLDRYLVRRR